MGDFDPGAGQLLEERLLAGVARADTQAQSPHMAFQTQFDYLPKLQQHQTQPRGDQYGSGGFNMGALVGALPPSSRGPISQHAPYESEGVLSPNSVYQMHHAAQYSSQRAPQLDMNALRAQQHHYLAAQYSPTTMQQPMAQRHSLSIQNPAQFARMDPYGYSMTAPQYSPVDPRFGPAQPFAMNTPMGPDFGQFARRASEPAPIPSYPRGPPRKPKQSGHALWVGNLPPAATVTDLKDHFSRDATKDIESLFLISKSNCAFVNYRTEAACVAAMNRFHDSRFHGVRLVCRLRRGSASSITTPRLDGIESPTKEEPDTTAGDATPTIVGSSQTEPEEVVATTEASLGGDSSAPKVPEKFFIIKSLTVQDLEASVRNGTWATQSHNETSLNEAFNDAENVYLIFSANKSGEYFGYARMASLISGEPVNLGSVHKGEESNAPGTPQSIPTPATETAPRGRVIDDSARGTIFWEAELSDDEGIVSPVKENIEGASGQNWGRQFEIEWLSTARLPFYRTRGLRNPWNANREVKIARDGTELEPNVGRRLVQMFHRPPPAHGGNAGGIVGGPVMGGSPQHGLQIRRTDFPWTGMAGRWQQATA